MSLQVKLQELKEMYDKGLVTTANYEEQQKLILSAQLGNEASYATQAPPSRRTSDFLDPKKNLSILGKLFVVCFMIMGAIWLKFNLSDTEGKNAVSKFAAETGIGKQVIPWPDRAEAVVKTLVQSNQQNIADAIQRILHPTGKNSSMDGFDISKLNDSIIVELRISWQGGFLGGDYTTVVAWEIGEGNHMQAKVTQDTAVVAVGDDNLRHLDEYFRTKVYPAFISGIGNY